MVARESLFHGCRHFTPRLPRMSTSTASRLIPVPYGMSTDPLRQLTRHVSRESELDVPWHHRGLGAADDVGFSGLLGCGFDPLAWLGWRWRGEGELLRLIGAASASAHWMT